MGGPSGVGKTVASQAVGRRLGLPWLQVDDLRLALQWSRASLPARTDELYYFLETPDVWAGPTERLRDALIAVGEVMEPAIEIVAANHVDTLAPVVLEGDGILPSLAERPRVRERAEAGLIRMVFLVEPEEGAILANQLARGRGVAGRSGRELRTEARAMWLYGAWLAEESRRRGLPVLEPQPWSTLPERIIAAADARRRAPAAEPRSVAP